MGPHAPNIRTHPTPHMDTRAHTRGWNSSVALQGGREDMQKRGCSSIGVFQLQGEVRDAWLWCRNLAFKFPTLRSHAIKEHVRNAPVWSGFYTKPRVAMHQRSKHTTSQSSSSTLLHSNRSWMWNPDNKEIWYCRGCRGGGATCPFCIPKRKLG